MTDPLQTLTTDLGQLATLNTANPASSPAAATAALTAAQEVLSILADANIVGATIGPTIGGFYKAIATVIDDPLVTSLQAIATELESLNIDTSDAATALTALQGALQTASTLVPGAPAATAQAFAATGQFATLFGSLLQDTDSPKAAAEKLNEIAQQLTTIADAFNTAAQGNP